MDDEAYDLREERALEQQKQQPWMKAKGLTKSLSMDMDTATSKLDPMLIVDDYEQEPNSNVMEVEKKPSEFSIISDQLSNSRQLAAPNPGPSRIALQYIDQTYSRRLKDVPGMFAARDGELAMCGTYMDHDRDATANEYYRMRWGRKLGPYTCQAQIILTLIQQEDKLLPCIQIQLDDYAMVLLASPPVQQTGDMNKFELLMTESTGFSKQRGQFWEVNTVKDVRIGDLAVLIVPMGSNFRRKAGTDVLNRIQEKCAKESKLKECILESAKPRKETVGDIVKEETFDFAVAVAQLTNEPKDSRRQD